MRYRMTCSCGEVLAVKAPSREEAIRKMKVFMNEAKVYEHMAQNHLRDQVPPIQRVHVIIEQNLKAAT